MSVLFKLLSLWLFKDVWSNLIRTNIQLLRAPRTIPCGGLLGWGHRVLFIDGHGVKIRKNAWSLGAEAEGPLTSAWMSHTHLPSSTSGAETGLGERGEGVQ